MMKGFLSRVRRVSGSSGSNSNGEGGGSSSDTATSTSTSSAPPTSHHETKDPEISTSSPSNSSKESNHKSNSSNKGIESTPRADVVLPKKNKRFTHPPLLHHINSSRRTSFNRSQKMQALKDLPLLSDTPTQKREVRYHFSPLLSDPYPYPGFI